MRIDLNIGLTKEEVTRLSKDGYSNVTVKNQSKSIGQIIVSNVFTYFNLVFAVFAVLLILVKSYINMTFLPIIVINTLIGIIQEIRSKRVLDRLTVLNEPHTTVIRDGIEQRVESEKLVKGDICIFSTGNQICADAVVRSGSLTVNESLVTGESEEITKQPGDMLLSGSFVISGICRAELTNVGCFSYASKLASEAKAFKNRKKTEMMISLDKLVKLIGVLIIPLGICMYCEHRFLMDTTIKESVVAIVASLVGMIPEGLYLLASIALVVSVMRLGKQNIIVHEMACIETLARVDVMCVDKTGTITNADMVVEDIKVADIGNNARQDIFKLFYKTVGLLDSDNATIRAVKEYIKTEERIANPVSMLKESKVCQFSSAYKYSGIVIENNAYLMGAPENLLLGDYDRFRQEIELYASKGIRVLVFGATDEVSSVGYSLKKPIKPYLFIMLSNSIRKNAKETFNYFQEQNVEIKVISGDNPMTVAYIADKAGIKNAKNYIDARTLTDDDIQNGAAVKYTVFGRVLPEQKRRIIEALKTAKRTVAMTGDGVNDVLALKKADCSIAMASGSEAASNVSQIVLLDSNFDAMPSVVLEGRRVVNNIQRSAALFLVKNIFSFVFTFFTMIMMYSYPIYPTQLSMLGAFTIGAPAFFLALQPNRSIIRGHFLTNVFIKAIPAAVADIISAVILTIYGHKYNLPYEQLSTMIILSMIVIGIAMLIRVSKPLNTLRMTVCITMVIGIVFSIIFLRKLFAIQLLPLNLFLITGLITAVCVTIFVLLCYMVRQRNY